MNVSVHNRLKGAMETAQGLYYRLVLLVGESGVGKTALLHDIASGIDVSVINVNLVVSSALLELTARQRSMRLTEILDQAVREHDSPVVLDNIELLFDHTLQQDPLRLLQAISRNRVVLAAWNGTMDNGRLIYAVPGHPEYRSYVRLMRRLWRLGGEGLGARG